MNLCSSTWITEIAEFDLFIDFDLMMKSGFFSSTELDLKVSSTIQTF